MIKSKNLSLDKKDGKKSAPLTVVIEMALLINKLLDFFSTLSISFLGISMKVSPKKTVFLLNLE